MRLSHKLFFPLMRLTEFGMEGLNKMFYFLEKKVLKNDKLQLTNCSLAKIKIVYLWFKSCYFAT